REFYQCDVDIVGAESILAEVEVMGTLAQGYHDVGLRQFAFHINSRKVLMGALEAYGVPEAQFGTVTIALDKLDKVGPDGVSKELVERGLPASVVDQLRTDLESGDVTARARGRAESVTSGRAALAELDEIARLLRLVLPEGGNVVHSPFLARGMDYYTGCIF